MSVFDEFGAQWIWLPQEADKVNQYAEFRHEFFGDGRDSCHAQLFISVDSEYAVWLNGHFINCGQYDDYPDNKVYDVIPVSSFLKPGRNVFCILAYYQGENSFQYIQGRPRLIYAINAGDTKISSGGSAFCRESTSYVCGPVPKITEQLSFTFEYNATGYDGWIQPDYALGSDWTAPSCTPPALDRLPCAFYERPIKKADIKEAVNARIISQGVFIRLAGGEKTVAQLMQTDYLSHRFPSEIFSNRFRGELPSNGGLSLSPSSFKDGQGVYIVIDLGREEAGLLELELDAEAGTVVDIAYGEHLDDLRVRASVGSRNFAARYFCAEGVQKFTHYFKRIAGRYLQLHILPVRTHFMLYYAGVRPAEYPIELKGNFHCQDHLFNRIYDVSVRTLQLCMHEHYEDTPWREQALYGMDSRIQALCGYYCFGEYDFPICSFELLGYSMKDDGYISLCAPAEFHRTIPSFSMAWIIELGDYLLYSGRTDRLIPLLPKLKTMMNSFLSKVHDDLMLTPTDNKYWSFYEWADGLDNFMPEAFSENPDSIRFDAPLNLFLCMALESAIKTTLWCGDTEAAGEYADFQLRIKKKFHKTFWDSKAGCYKTYAGKSGSAHYSELVQALALCSGACPDEIAPLLRDRLSKTDNGLVKTSLSYSLYKYQALLGEPEKYAPLVFEQIARDWGGMLYHNATSFWETIKGADDFHFGGSLSHGWSAIPIYFFYAYVLGIVPLEPGFKKFTAEPAPCSIQSASGRISTPYGAIEITRRESIGKAALEIHYPDEIEMVKPV